MSTTRPAPTTCLPSLDAAAPFKPGQLHVRVSSDGQVLTALALSTATSLAPVLPTLLVIPISAAGSDRTDRLLHLASLPDHSAPSVVVTDDLDEVFDALTALETRTGRAGVLVLEAIAPFSASELVAKLRSYQRAGTRVVLHHRSPVRSLRGGLPAVVNTLPSSLTMMAHVLAEVSCSSAGLLDVTLLRNRSGPCARVPLALEEGVVKELVPDASLAVALLQEFDAGRTLVELALASFDLDTSTSLSRDWTGTLAELVTTLEDLGPDARAA